MTSLEPVYSKASESFRQLLALWKLSRYGASNKELHSKFSGLRIKRYAYHLIWNDSERWKRIIIHLGDLHSFTAFLGVIGNIQCR